MKKEKSNFDYDEDFLSTSSATEMTGLIPAAPTNPDETDEYEELFPYLPSPTSKHNDNK